MSDNQEQDIYADIRAERARQDAQWGGAEHDDSHTRLDWASYRHKFESLALAHLDPADARRQLVKIAALAIAQIESLNRTTSPSRTTGGLHG